MSRGTSTMRLPEHHRVLHLGVDDLAVVGDGGERADVAVDDARARRR